MRHLVVDKEVIIVESSSSINRIINDSKKKIDNDDLAKCDIVNLAKSIEDKVEKKEKFFSIELFSSKKYDKEVYESFFLEFNRKSNPLFYALTWHDNTTNDDIYLPIKILKNFPNNTLMHIAANNLMKNDIVKILNAALSQGKTNIFVLRGDDCSGIGDFVHASDLVKFIRNHYHSKFTICVAGYPQMHPESASKEIDFLHLKEKVEAGANFIITQIFFESKIFIEFVNDCRKYGITVPIIPGIFPIPNFKSLNRMAKLCSVEIPQKLLKELQPIKDNDNTVKSYGIALARKLISEIFESGTATGFHLFTLNRASIALDVCR